MSTPTPGSNDTEDAIDAPEPDLPVRDIISLDPGVFPYLRSFEPALAAYTDPAQTGTEIESGLLAAAHKLTYLRHLSPYPGWRFSSDWDNPDSAFRMRRFIWTYFHNLYRDTPFQMKLHQGLTIELNLGNDLSLPIFLGGCLDPNEFAFLASVLKPGMVFVDGGANEGWYSLFAASWVGPAGQVIAFEPSEREFQRLSRNIRLNGRENIRAIRTALSDAPGEVNLNVARGPHEGQNTLGAFAYQIPLLRIDRVPAQTLDRFVIESALTRIDVLKLDVEGAERRMLEGSRRVLREMRPILLFEGSEAALSGQGSNLSDVLAFLRLQDYRLYAFHPETGTPVPDMLGDNMIALPSEHPARPSFNDLRTEI